MALILPLVAMLSIGVVDLGRGFAARTDANHAAEAAARALSKSSSADYAGAAKAEDSGAWSAYSCTVPAKDPTVSGAGAPANPLLPTPGTGGVIKVYVKCTLSLFTPLVKNATGPVTIITVAVSRAAW